MQDQGSSATKINIKELARLLDVSASTLRNIELIYHIDVERNQLGQRIYNNNTIKLFKKICTLKSESLQPQEIKNIIDADLQLYERYYSGARNIAEQECDSPKIEVIQESFKENKNFDLSIVNKYESRIIQLSDQNNSLNRQLGQAEGEIKKFSEVIELKDSIIKDRDLALSELKERLKKFESRSWWSFWRK